MANALVNDKEYILAGIVLADGWHTLDTAIGFLEIVKTYHGFGGPDSDKEIIDALAAQLVRQIDTNGRVIIRAERWWTEIAKREGKIICHVEGDDRTMNTIKCVVDSGLLK